jgi:2-polyprenyl-6-methoxyphenol hydroxylase-like FAD-dependent oxidoreductase
MTRPHKALIVGGGIGGLSTAIGLRKAGIHADIVEIKKQWMVYHVGIIVHANFLRAMVALDIADKCVAAGFAYQHIRHYDPRGNFLSALEGQRLAGPDYPANLGLSRPALHRVLSETAIGAGASVRLGVTVSRLVQSDDKVNVEFTDGTVADYDIVIGADGVHSQIRGMVFGHEHQPKFTGQGVWRYTIPRPKDLDHLVVYVSELSGRAGVVPLTQDTAYLFKVGPEPGNPHHADDQLHELLRARLAAFGGLIGEIRDRYINDPAQVVYRPLEAFLLPNPWYRGRVLLIGDAVHSTTPQLGQGAAQAVEDAVVLAELLGQHAPLSELLDAFMKRRYERSKFIVESSLQIGEWEQRPTRDADFIGLMAKVLAVVSAPI